MFISKLVKKPWGHFQTFTYDHNFLIKKIVVLPGQRLSLQKHRFRSEHWIVVEGKATVTVGGDVMTFFHNQHIFIPTFVQHRVENLEVTNLEIIEVQTGSKFLEEDIIRIEDDYDRV